MTGVENTTKRDPLIHFAEALGDTRPGQFIERMESQGQSQFVNSEVLPTNAPWAELEALGFVRGELVEGDELFTKATLPEGWKKLPTDHSMWSKILDTRGLEMASVFYKAAFYDRDAFMRLSDPGARMATDLLYADEPPAALPEEFALFTDRERASFWGRVDEMKNNIVEYPSIYDKYQPFVDVVETYREKA